MSTKTSIWATVSTIFAVGLSFYLAGDGAAGDKAALHSEINKIADAFAKDDEKWVAAERIYSLDEQLTGGE